MNIQLENMYKIKRINRRSHPTTKAVGFPAFVVMEVVEEIVILDMEETEAMEEIVNMVEEETEAMGEMDQEEEAEVVTEVVDQQEMEIMVKMVRKNKKKFNK